MSKLTAGSIRRFAVTPSILTLRRWATSLTRVRVGNNRNHNIRRAKQPIRMQGVFDRRAATVSISINHRPSAPGESLTGKQQEGGFGLWTPHTPGKSTGAELGNKRYRVQS